MTSSWWRSASRPRATRSRRTRRARSCATRGARRCGCASPSAAGERVARAGSARRRDAPELAVVLVGDEVERAVGSLTHVADALVAIRQQVLLSRDAIVLEHEAH